MHTHPATDRLSFRAAARSEVGTVRANNEDSAYISDDLLVLADGMGGHSSGEVASAVAVHTFAGEESPPPQGFTTAATRTRRILQRMSRADESLETMGTTIVALRHHEGSFSVCHIGDSRLYVLREGELAQITTDHTHVQHLVETGRITPEQIPTHPYRAMLLKSLDDQPGGAAPDVIAEDLRAGDRVLLCSDGLSDYVPAHIIRGILGAPDPQTAADDLITAALAAGTRDNITVIVADLAGGGVTSPEFTGAAGEPITLSREAAEALREADPDFPGTVRSTDDTDDDPLTRTTVLTQAEVQGKSALAPRGAAVPWPGILAGVSVVLLGLAIALVL